MRIIIRHIPPPDELRSAAVRRIHLDHQPVVNHLHHVALLFVAEAAPPRDRVPLFQTAATAGRGGMLGDKHRMSAHRGLLTVIRNLRRGQPTGDKVRRVLVDNLRTLIKQYCRSFTPRRKRERKVERCRRANRFSMGTIRIPTSPVFE